MKKVAGIIASALLLFPLSANAAINTTIDKTGTTTYISKVNSNGPWNSVKLQYTKGKPTSMITLSQDDPSYASNPTYSLFSDKTQLIIDNSVSDLKLIDTYRDIDSDLGIFEFTPTQIAKIQSAKKVAMKVSFYNKHDITWNVSDKLLNEWKEVFSRNQNQITLQNSINQTSASIHNNR